ncbi:MAG: glycosyltransferase family 39 protein, partial [Candidatus Dormibacteraceae bacterium]
MRGAQLRWLAVLPPLALAAGLAVWSLGFGLPFLFRPDEDVMVGRAVRMAAQGSLDPLFANYPPLVFYLFAGVEKAVALAGGANLHAAFTDPSAAYLAARAVSAAAAVATVGFTFAAGRRAYGTVAGLIAAGLLAVAPLAVRQAHFATTDGVQTAFVAAAMAAGLRARGRRGLALAGT